MPSLELKPPAILMLMGLTLAALALFSLMRCAGPLPVEGVEPFESTVLTAAEPCGMAFDVQAPELLAATTQAASRWSKATGCDVRVEAGGTPIVVVNDLRTSTGKISAGAMRHTGDNVCKRIDIDSVFGGPQTLTHEMGHCLGAIGHAASGLMAEGAPGVINTVTLEHVCAQVECQAFTPEL
jgi:hypothetical protein